MGGDYLSIVEAAYERAPGPDEWLGNLLSAMRPCLDRGDGVVALRFRREPTAVWTGGHRYEGLDPTLLPHIEELWKAFPPEWIRSAFPLAPTATWLSQLVGPSPLRLASAHIETLPSRARIRFAGYDALGVIGADPSGHGCIVFTRCTRVRLGGSEVAIWRRVATHIAAGYRLARARSRKPDAVLDPGGKLVHREAGVGGEEARDLGAATQAIDRARGRLRRAEPERALELWKGLVSGRWSLVDQIDHDGRRFVVAKRNPIERRAWESLTARETQVVACTAEGCALKTIGYQLGISTTTAATDLASARRKLRFASRLELVAAYRRRQWAKRPS